MRIAKKKQKNKTTPTPPQKKEQTNKTMTMNDEFSNIKISFLPTDLM